MLSFIFCCANSFANDFGLGVILGGPTGISGNYVLSEKSSVDGALAYDLSHDHNFHIQSDYLRRNLKSIKLGQYMLGWYWGIGAKLRSDEDKDDNFRIGPRIALGTNYEFESDPVELFAETSLTMNLIPRTDADIGLGIGMRYYFK